MSDHDLTSHQRKALRDLVSKQAQYSTLGFLLAPTGVLARTMTALTTKGFVERELPFRSVRRYRPTKAGREAVA